MLIFSFPNLYAHEWKCPMLSKLDSTDYTFYGQFVTGCVCIPWQNEVLPVAARPA